MKKSVKKAINRIKPVSYDWDNCYSYTYNPVILLGFSDSGELIISRREFIGTEFRKETLSVKATDYFWISYKKAKKAKNNSLNCWRGHYVHRTIPMTEPYEDKSFMETYKKYKLIVASKHHVFLQKDNGEMKICNYLYSNSKEWELND